MPLRFLDRLRVPAQHRLTQPKACTLSEVEKAVGRFADLRFHDLRHKVVNRRDLERLAVLT